MGPMRVNVDELSDPAHGIHKDFAQAMERVKMKKHMRLFRIAWDAPQGPWGEGRRYKEVAASYPRTLGRYAKPQNSPLVMELLPYMIAEASDRDNCDEQRVT